MALVWLTVLLMVVGQADSFSCPIKGYSKVDIYIKAEFSEESFLEVVETRKEIVTTKVFNKKMDEFYNSVSIAISEADSSDTTISDTTSTEDAESGSMYEDKSGGGSGSIGVAVKKVQIGASVAAHLTKIKSESNSLYSKKYGSYSSADAKSQDSSTSSDKTEGGKTVTEDENESLVHIESSVARKFKEGFNQRIQEITTRVTVDGDTFELIEKTFKDSIPNAKSPTLAELQDSGAQYINKFFGMEVGGHIVENTFSKSICFLRHTREDLNDIEKLKGKTAELEAALATTTSLLETALQSTTARLESRITETKTELAATKTELVARIDETAAVKILGTDTKCQMICSGNSPASTWSSPVDGRMDLTVDMTACGFKSTPVITTSGRQPGTGNSWLTEMIGTSAVLEASATRFKMELRGAVHTAFSSRTTKPSLSEAQSENWSISWTAVGYSC